MTDPANPTPAIDALLAELRAMMNAATPRPWRIGYEGAYGEGACHIIQKATSEHITGYIVPSRWDLVIHDHALIVAAVNALPALRGEIERLRAELARARGYEQEAVSHLRAVCDPCGNHVTAVMGARAWLVGGHDA